MTDDTPQNPGSNPLQGTPGHDSTSKYQPQTPAQTPARTPTGADSVHPAENAVAGAEQAARKVTDAMTQAVSPEIPDLKGTLGPESPQGIGLLEDVQLQVRIELGRTRMLVEDVLRLGSGAVVELDKAAGDPVDIFVNGRRIARGEVLVLNENFCVRVSEIMDPQAMSV
jgi:flagellar motor switch protein FliN/FliY